jgi:hypothetical protein
MMIVQLDLRTVTPATLGAGFGYDPGVNTWPS